MAKKKAAAKRVSVDKARATPADLAALVCQYQARAKRLYRDADGVIDELMTLVKMYEPITLKNGRVARVLPGSERQAYRPQYELRVSDT